MAPSLTPPRAASPFTPPSPSLPRSLASSLPWSVPGVAWTRCGAAPALASRAPALASSASPPSRARASQSLPPPPSPSVPHMP
eukprot:1686034-Rhodomonas_salina.1